MFRLCSGNDGYDGVELDSDDDDGMRSSGDEKEEEFALDISIRKFLLEHEAGERGSQTVDVEESLVDEFEKELNNELDSTVAELERRRFQRETETNVAQASTSKSSKRRKGHKREDLKHDKAVESPKTGPNVQAELPLEEQYYDDEYYDSDASENMDDVGKCDATPQAAAASDKPGACADQENKAKMKRHPIISNDDLLYDPDIDDDNQKWMDEQRASQRAAPLKRKGKIIPAPNSDAILDCPACMTTVCIDCQRHELYEHQFRAMFVQNCRVDKDEKITASLNESTRKRKHGKTPKSGKSASVESNGDIFSAVKCSRCNTVVGAMDEDEIYYFYNVLPSHT